MNALKVFSFNGQVARFPDAAIFVKLGDADKGLESAPDVMPISHVGVTVGLIQRWVIGVRGQA